jgi:hypothetical protein
METNTLTITPEFREWLDREIERLTAIRDKWLINMVMEQGRKNGEIETLTLLRENTHVIKPLVVELESPNGQVNETEVIGE